MLAFSPYKEAGMPDFDEFFTELDSEIERKRRHGTWPAYIVRALLLSPECNAKQDALKAIRRDCEKRGRDIPKTFSDTVQAIFESHNSGSDVFASKGSPDRDLFFFAGQKGEGKWGLRVDCATAWMIKNKFELVPSAIAVPTHDQLSVLGFDAALEEGQEVPETTDISAILASARDETTKKRLVEARLGQGEFREELLGTWDEKCVLTGCSFKPLLRASHIKPWRESNDKERLDPNNGLLLAAHIDALFDRFLISFSNDGALLVSDRVPEGLLVSLGVSGRAKARLRTENRKYLKWHRKEFGANAPG